MKPNPFSVKIPFFLREADPRKVKPGKKSQLAEGEFFERFETAKTANQEKKTNWQKRLARSVADAAVATPHDPPVKSPATEPHVIR